MERKRHFVFVGLSALCGAAFLGGCSHVVLFDPKGPIGEAERFVILVAIALMLIVVIPVIIMSFLFARRYRASNTEATYTPNWSYSAKIDLVIWLVPVAIVTALGILAWSETHRLNPYNPIERDVKPISIEAVSLDWKWLFIYPDHHIATVSEFVFPANVPLSFRITSDTVMTSFFIPQLGSQIYAMAGMQTRLHLMADEPGVYHGQNQQFSGRGFADMNFDAIALPQDQFEAWVQKTKQSPDKLDLARFQGIAESSVGYPVTYFSSVKPDLFDYIISKYRSMGMNRGATSKESGSTHGKSGVSEEG
jgi:cytochrome o ubiquinol oxidase subunit 2